MKTDKKAVELRVLTAEDGHFLRRKDAVDPIHFSEVVYLGVGDSESNYVEVTAGEVEAYNAAREAVPEEGENNSEN